jgi:hypothetical protein
LQVNYPTPVVTLPSELDLEPDTTEVWSEPPKGGRESPRGAGPAAEALQAVLDSLIQRLEELAGDPRPRAQISYESLHLKRDGR